MALRSNPAVQRRVKQASSDALSRWRADPAVKAIQQDLGRFAEGEMLEELPQLSQLMHSQAAAHGFVECWAGNFLGVLAVEPLAQIPFQHNYSGGFAMMQLANAGKAALSLVCYEQKATESSPEAAHFSDCERHELVLAGMGKARLHQIRDEGSRHAVIETNMIELEPGRVLSTMSRCVTRDIYGVRGRLLMLQLHRQPANCSPTRDFTLPDGNLLHQASGTKRDSQCEMAMAVLGAMGRADAVPAMLALSRTGTSQLRWEAMRHALALETASGFDRLAEVAQDSVDPLAPHASQVHAQLLETYPQLSEQEKIPCPA